MPRPGRTGQRHDLGSRRFATCGIGSSAISLRRCAVAKMVRSRAITMLMRRGESAFSRRVLALAEVFDEERYVAVIHFGDWLAWRPRGRSTCALEQKLVVVRAPLR